MANVRPRPDGRTEDYSKKEVKGYGKGKEAKVFRRFRRRKKLKEMRLDVQWMERRVLKEVPMQR